MGHGVIYLERNDSVPEYRVKSQNNLKCEESAVQVSRATQWAITSPCSRDIRNRPKGVGTRGLGYSSRTKRLSA